MITINYKGREYPIKITYLDAIDKFPADFNIHLCDMFADEDKMMETMNNLIMNDIAVLQLMYHYVGGTDEHKWESFLEDQDSQSVTRFRESFWDAVTVFSGPLKKDLMTKLWQEAKKEFKNASQGLTLGNSFSDSHPEESTSTTSP